MTCICRATFGNLGKLHMEVGRTDEAQARCAQSLAIARDAGNRRLEANMLCNLEPARFPLKA